MIRSFRHRRLRSLFEKDDSRGLPAALVPKIRRMLLAVHAAADPSELGKMPGWRLHPLRGDLAGQWSLTVSGNWRLVFRFEAGDAFDLDFMDYH